VVADADVAAAGMALVAALEAGSPPGRIRELISEWHRLVELQDDQRADEAECMA
jgi:hypothetical protein